MLSAVGEGRADLFQRAARAGVVLADEEDDAVEVRQRVGEHQALHRGVDGAAPVRAGEEGVADLDLTGFGARRVEARRTDDRAAGRHRPRRARRRWPARR